MSTRSHKFGRQGQAVYGDDDEDGDDASGYYAWQSGAGASSANYLDDYNDDYDEDDDDDYDDDDYDDETSEEESEDDGKVKK